MIEQWFDGVKFRSTLEARWAVFFNAAGIRWEYEPEGFIVGGKAYRPDFLLRDCGTWVEVKGDPARLDLELMAHAAIELPRPAPKCEAGPPLMILGNFPPPQATEQGDWAFTALHQAFPPGFRIDGRLAISNDGSLPVIEFAYFSFGMYSKNLRPWWADGFDVLPGDITEASKVVLEPRFVAWEVGIPEAYAIARAHRFGRR